MKNINSTLRILLTLIAFVITQQLLADTTFVKFGSTWKYLDVGSAAPTGSGAADWRNIAFNDASWSSGPAELGYGDNDERTIVSYGANPNSKYTSTYFRFIVDIPNKALFTGMRINTYADDGVVIYVNGTEVVRTNMPAGATTYSMLATAAATEDGNVITQSDIATTSFVNGNNIIAVEVHQNAVTSSDLTFDLELIGKTAGTYNISRGPFMQMLAPDGVTFKWTTSANADSRIIYGTDPNNLNNTVTNSSLVTDHELRVTGLSADMKYYYAIGSTGWIVEGSYRNYFVTAPLKTTTRKIRIGVFGDPGTANANQKSTRDSYLSLKTFANNSDLALFLGDNAYNGGLDAEHQTNFFNIYDDNVLDNHPLFLVPGNHEYNNSPGTGGLAGTHAIPYYSIFSLPTNAESGGTVSGTEHYYSFDYGNIHFIMLDSYGYDGSKLLYDSTGAQALWLKSDLASYTTSATRRKWIIVSLHHPPYTHGTHNSDSEGDLVAIRQQITPILERFGVDLVLAGHSHVYERSFLVQGHTGLSGTFAAANKKSSSSARYDGTNGNVAGSDSNAATSSCPYFMIDSSSNKGTVYVVAGSAGQIGAATNSIFPVFYYKNYSGSTGGETGVLYLEVEDNRIDGKFVGTSGTIRDRFTIMKGVNKSGNISVKVNTSKILTSSWIGGYNWYMAPAPPITVIGTGRSLSITPNTLGTYTYYVNDSIAPKTTCISDTFTVQVLASLAVTLQSLEVFAKNEAAYLQWTTSFEENSENFTIERSVNGRDFDFLMIVKAAGNSSTPVRYEYIDYRVKEGTYYYRLIQTDKDGKSRVLGTRKINFKSSLSFSVVIKPNPVLNNQVTGIIHSDKKQFLQLRVIDMNGNEVYKSRIRAEVGDNKFGFPLKAGSYVLTIIRPDGKQIREKLIVN